MHKAGVRIIIPYNTIPAHTKGIGKQIRTPCAPPVSRLMPHRSGDHHNNRARPVRAKGKGKGKDTRSRSPISSVASWQSSLTCRRRRNARR